VKVGVLLAPPPADLGDWLAAAAAFDTAGADALWIDVASDPGLDPLAVTAALAVLTFRSLLVVAPPAGADDRTLATVERLSRGRLARHADYVRAGGDFVRDGEAVREGGADFVGAHADFVRDGEADFVRAGGGEPERWVRAEWSGGRAAWRAVVADATERGATGLLVPATPPLLDLLRNPGGPGDRSDLQIAQG
jgi:hypothetical protein